MANGKLTEGLAVLQNEPAELQAAGTFSKVEKAEKLIATVTELVGDLVADINGLRADFENLKQNGFQ